MTQEAMGSKEASSSPNLKTNLVVRARQWKQWKQSGRGTRSSLGGVVGVVLNPLQFKVDKVCGVKWTGLFQFHRLHSGGHAVEVRVGSQTGRPSTDQVES